jgi:hypothetical protein
VAKSSGAVVGVIHMVERGAHNPAVIARLGHHHALLPVRQWFLVVNRTLSNPCSACSVG